MTTEERLQQPWSKLTAAAAGESVAHIWTSPRFGEAPVTIVYSAPEQEVAADQHGLPVEFAESIGLTYAGAWTPTEAQTYIDAARERVTAAFEGSADSHSN